MKIMMMVLALSFCANSNAFDTTIGVSGATIFLSSVSSGNKPFGKEEAIMKDVNEYYNSGSISLALAEEIKDVQSQFNVSEREAVDIIADTTDLILSSK